MKKIIKLFIILTAVIGVFFLDHIFGIWQQEFIQLTNGVTLSFEAGVCGLAVIWLVLLLIANRIKNSHPTITRLLYMVIGLQLLAGIVIMCFSKYL